MGPAARKHSPLLARFAPALAALSVVATSCNGPVALASTETVVPAGERFTCTPERVWDGDGPIWCAEGPRLRLAGIAAREMDGTCRPGHPCPAASGEAARDALAAMLGRVTGKSGTGHVEVTGLALSCLSDGSAGNGRTAAWCASPTAGDLSCAMIRGGYALRWDRYWRGHKCGAVR